MHIRRIDPVIGEELEAFLARKGEEYDRIAYIGDGSNDFCPILRLRRRVRHGSFCGNSSDDVRTYQPRH